MKRFIDKYFANQNSPITGPIWRNLSYEKKVKLIKSELEKDKIYEKFFISKVDEDGQIVLKIEHDIPAHTRGVMLLELEEKLKNNVDKGITIWLEPIGDKSKLRNLRGISFKEI